MIYYAYILLGILVIYILFVVYCKMRYRFWSVQPVFHIHNIWYWLFPPGIIQHSLPPMTKFYDPQVEFYFWTALNDEKKEQFYRLNEQYYLQDDNISYKPSRECIFNYFEKHNDPCFITLLFENDPLFHYSKNTIIPRQNCIASLTSRPLNVLLDQQPLKVNYVDYLCVAKKNRKKGIAPCMIYSYYYHSRRNHKTLVYLFKREGIGTFITPLTVYLTYGFYIKKPTINQNIPLLINATSFSLFYHYLKTIKKAFPCFIQPTTSHIKHLVEQKLLYIFVLMDGHTPWGCYIFRNPYTHYKNDGASIDCIASYCSDPQRIDEFIYFFDGCLAQIDYTYQYLLIENISHNIHIIKHKMKTENPFLKSHTSYYLYNFAYRPFLSENVFIIS